MMEAATVDSALIDRFFSVFEVPKKFILIKEQILNQDYLRKLVNRRI